MIQEGEIGLEYRQNPIRSFEPTATSGSFGFGPDERYNSEILSSGAAKMA